jgi:hypothetical protein
MIGTLSTKKGIIYWDWVIMQSYYNDDGTFKLNLEAKNSKDQIRLTLEKEDAERLFNALKPKNTEGVNQSC